MSKKRGEKKAQLTIFVIVGLVVLIVAGIFFIYIGKNNGSSDLKPESVPEEFKPVSNYVQSCIHQLGVEAVKKMGAHGGYINPLDKELTPVNLRFDSADQTNSDLVSLTGDSGSLVPYYLHVPGKASPNQFSLSSAAPTIENMQYQISAYIIRELPRCVGGFESLESQGFDVSEDNSALTCTVLIKDDQIEIFVGYPLNITKEGTGTKITKYQDVLRFPLKRYYDLAVQFAYVELYSQFLESFTKRLINYHSGIDFSSLPPTIDYSHSMIIPTWSNSKVNYDINDLLISYVPALQVKGTKGFKHIELGGADPVENGFFESLSLSIFNQTDYESTKKLSINFYYPSDSVLSEVKPSRGDIISPSISVQKGDDSLPETSFSTFKFFYDVSYPVVVEVRGSDPSKEIPEFSFVFALEQNLIENKGPLAWNLGLGTVQWDYSNIDMTIDIPEGSIVDEQGKAVEVRKYSPAKSMFCDQDTWVSGDVKLRTIDADTGAPLDGVSVIYSCGTYDECYAGTTKLSEDGSAASWSGKMPLCKGGRLNLIKDGFGSRSIKLSTSEDEPVWLASERLNKIRKINATIKKEDIIKSIYRELWEWKEGLPSIGEAKELSDTEQVILTIRQVGFDSSARPMSSTIIFGKDGVESQAINIVPGEYEVTATLIDHARRTIPKECTRICKYVLCCDADRGDTCPIPNPLPSYTYFPEKEQLFESMPWGGVDISSKTAGSFQITKEQLDAAKRIEFHVMKLPDLKLANPTGGCLKHLEELNNVEEYSTKFSAALMPTFLT